MKLFVYIIFVLLYLGVTFFGVGPILLADGTVEERVWTGIVVLGIYIGLTVLFVVSRGYIKKNVQ